jgi:hypothetical protein
MPQIVKTELLRQAVDIGFRLADGALNQPRPAAIGAVSGGHHELARILLHRRVQHVREVTRDRDVRLTVCRLERLIIPLLTHADDAAHEVDARDPQARHFSDTQAAERTQQDSGFQIVGHRIVKLRRGGVGHVAPTPRKHRLTNGDGWGTASLIPFAAISATLLCAT